MDVKRTGRRRVSTAPAPGSDPRPQDVPASAPVRAAEDTDQAWGDAAAPRPGASGPNDDRLRQDVPPHY